MSRLIMQSTKGPCSSQVVDFVEWMKRMRFYVRQDPFSGDVAVDATSDGPYALLLAVANHIGTLVVNSGRDPENVRLRLAALSPGCIAQHLEIDACPRGSLGAFFDCSVRERNEFFSWFRDVLMNPTVGLLSVTQDRLMTWVPEGETEPVTSQLMDDPTETLGTWRYVWSGPALTWSRVEDAEKSRYYEGAYFFAGDSCPTREEVASWFMGEKTAKRLKPDLSPERLGFGIDWLLTARRTMVNRAGEQVSAGMQGVVKRLLWEDLPRPHVGVVFQNGAYFVDPIDDEVPKFYTDWRPSPFA